MRQGAASASTGTKDDGVIDLCSSSAAPTELDAISKDSMDELLQDASTTDSNGLDRMLSEIMELGDNVAASDIDEAVNKTITPEILKTWDADRKAENPSGHDDQGEVGDKITVRAQQLKEAAWTHNTNAKHEVVCVLRGLHYSLNY